MIAFRQLLRPDTAFQWNDELENAFQESKKVIAKEIEEGITGWQTALVGSCFTQSNEANYAPVEGKALAVIDGLHNVSFFVLGCKELIVAVDDKPLLKIFGDRSLNDIEKPRLRNLKEKTLQFQFQDDSSRWGKEQSC